MDADEQLKPRPPFGGLAIALYCAVRSEHLLAAWRHSPFDRLGWVALLLWLTPLVMAWRSTPRELRLGRVNFGLLGLSLLVSLLGTMASMNAIKYLGLAVAVVALIRWRRAHLVWFIGAASWMPAFGYFAAKIVGSGATALWLVLLLRVAWAATSVFCLWKLSPIWKMHRG